RCSRSTLYTDAAIKAGHHDACVGDSPVEQRRLRQSHVCRGASRGLLPSSGLPFCWCGTNGHLLQESGFPCKVHPGSTAAINFTTLNYLCGLSRSIIWSGCRNRCELFRQWNEVPCTTTPSQRPIQASSNLIPPAG